MSTIKDGGPAFPRTYNGDGHNGMTLRDYFASKAMNGLILNGRSMDLSVGVENALAELSYRIADAMLAAREAQS
jgi:hypothetical protein